MDVAITWQRWYDLCIILRINGVKCLRFRGPCKAGSLYNDDAEWFQVIAGGFRSCFLPFMHVFGKIMANCDSSSLRDLWSEHCDLFIKDLCNRFRRYRSFLRNDSDALANARFEVRDYLSDMVDAPFSTLRLPRVWEGLTSCLSIHNNKLTCKIFAISYIPPFQPLI